MDKVKCTPCNDDNKVTEARKFCKDCNISLCVNCLDLHYRILKNHTLEEVYRQDHGERELLAGETLVRRKDIPLTKGVRIRPEPSAPPRYEDVVNQSHGNPPPTYEAVINQSLDNPVKKSSGYFLIGKKTTCVRIDGDLLSPHILGICQLFDGSIVIADNSNEKLKRLQTYFDSHSDVMNMNYCVTDFCDLPEAPFDVCYLGNEEVAVSLSGGMIQFVQISQLCLRKTRYLTLNHSCYGLDFRSNLLHVGDGSSIYVYSLGGQQYPNLYSDSTTTASATRFKLSDDGIKLFVVNYAENYVNMFDTKTTLSVPFIQNIEGTKDVAVANENIIFTCGLDSNVIAQFDFHACTALEKRGFEQVGLCQPQSLCFDKINSILLVGQCKNDYMAVLFIK